MFKLEYFFKSSSFLKTIGMLFTMVTIIGLITTYVHADQWNYSNNPSRFQIDYSYNPANLSFSGGSWANSQIPTWITGTYMPNAISNQIPYDWAPGAPMPWATNNWGKASSFVLAYEPVWAVGSGSMRTGAGYMGQQGQQGFFADSFFDVFTELSVDGGQNWMGMNQGYMGQQGQQGFFADSFFDVFTELSVDGGQNWMETGQYGTQGDGFMGIRSSK